MDGDRFDRWTKRVAAGEISRRTILRGLVGGTLGGAAALLGRHESAAFICRQPGVLCAKDAHCCSGSCGEDHRCACPGDLHLCPDRTCAACCTSHDCAPDFTCQAGTCVPTCVAKTCDEQGVACGPADNGCGGHLDCGECASGTCCGGQCVDTASNPQHCGNCATDCTAIGRNACCSGACVNTDFDESHCGDCATACPDDPDVACIGGGCCQTGFGPDALCSHTLPCCIGTCIEQGYCFSTN